MMICSYCGIEWKRLRAASGLNHEENGCPMSGVYTYPPVIACANKAIEAAKVDKRKMDQCKWAEGLDFCGQYGSLQTSICPCAAFARKE